MNTHNRFLRSEASLELWESFQEVPSHLNFSLEPEGSIYSTMTLKEHIEDIRDNLKKGFFTNEAAVSQGIVLRLIGALDWPTYDTQVVNPEYGVEGTRVDFALCHPPSKPRAFIEAKQVGNIKGAEEQLFGYDSRVRVPIAILTDGREWQFFHPTGEGTWAERKVCELDLITGDSGENAERLNRYLNYESILMGEAVEAIKEDYEKVVQQRQVATQLPEAWNRLVEEADEFLLHTVAEKTEILCGHRPTDDQVLNFLKNLEKKTELNPRGPLSPTISPVQPEPRHRNRKQKSPQTRLVVTMPNGEKIDHNVVAITFAEVIEKLGIERVRNLECQVNRIPLISTSNHTLYNQHKSGQYYIMTNTSTKKKKRLLEEIAADLHEPLKVEIID